MICWWRGSRIRCRFRKNYDGCFFKGKTLGGDVKNPWEGEQGHGTGHDSNLQGASHHRLEKKPEGFWKTRLHLLEATGGGVCGRMLLAWVSGACNQAQKQRGVLGKEVGEKQGARPDSQ